MKKISQSFYSFCFLVSCLLLGSCTPIYYAGETVEDVNLYSTSNGSSGITYIIPAKSKVLIRKKNRYYHHLTYNSTTGYAFLPRLSNYHRYNPAVDGSHTMYFTGQSNRSNGLETSSNYRVRNDSTYTPSSGGRVNVRGYTRKDGTYVQPHTRSAPTRKH